MNHLLQNKNSSLYTKKTMSFVINKTSNSAEERVKEIAINVNGNNLTSNRAENKFNEYSNS